MGFWQLLRSKYLRTGYVLCYQTETEASISETYLFECDQQPQLLRLSADAQDEMEGKAGLVIDLPAEDEKEELVVRIESASDTLAVGTVLDFTSTTTIEPEIGPQKPPAMGVRRTSCTYDCYCICHDDDWESSVVVLKRNSKVFGRVSKSKAQCSEPKCRRAATSSVDKKKLVIPSSWFRQGLTSLIMNRGWTIKHHLHTYRIVPETSESMKYARHGDLHNLKACIENGSATPFDTAPDGWSLLHVKYLRNSSIPYISQPSRLHPITANSPMSNISWKLERTPKWARLELGTQTSPYCLRCC
jgi:hypothetical protein